MEVQKTFINPTWNRRIAGVGYPGGRMGNTMIKNRRTYKALAVLTICPLLTGCNTLMQGSGELLDYVTDAGKVMGKAIGIGTTKTVATVSAAFGAEGSATDDGFYDVTPGVEPGRNQIVSPDQSYRYDYGGGYYAKPPKRPGLDF